MLAARLRFHLIPIVLLALLVSRPAMGRTAAWVPLGPEGGTIEAIVFAPSAPNVVYAATLGGGVFASVDGGNTWRHPGGEPAGRTVLALAVDPEDPAVAYAGTSDGVVWKTTSSGAAWTAFSHRLGGFPVLALALDPVHRQAIYAGTDHGVFRAANPAGSWVARSTGLPAGARVEALDIDPATPSTLFAGVNTAASSGGFFRSGNGGATWSRVSFGQSPVGFFSGFARSSRTLYVALLGELFRSDDDGATWATTPGSSQLLEVPTALAVGPDGTLYAGIGIGIQVSTDAGESFTYVGSTGPQGQIEPFGGVQSLAVAPSVPGRILIGTAGRGVLRLSGSALVASSRGLTATWITGLEIDPTSPSHVYAAEITAGIFESRDAGARGASWQLRDTGLLPEFGTPPLEVESLALSPGNPAVLYAGLDGGIVRSRDGARSWTFADVNECSTASAIAVDPRSSTVYAGGRPITQQGCTLGCFAFVSRDGGQTWGCMPGVYELDDIVVDPVRSAVVYVADYSASNGTLWKSTDRGVSFVRADRGLGSQWVLSLGVSPAANRTIYAGTKSGGLFRSNDGAAHWEPTGALPAGPVVGVAVDPANAARVYAAVQGAGVFASVDSGAHWQPLGGLPGALPEILTKSLRISNSTPRVLYAGTVGAGVWALALP
jgi:photosystem II stability/assembly factor-like uncharacterized protein